VDAQDRASCHLNASRLPPGVASAPASGQDLMHRTAAPTFIARRCRRYRTPEPACAGRGYRIALAEPSATRHRTTVVVPARRTPRRRTAGRIRDAYRCGIPTHVVQAGCSFARTQCSGNRGVGIIREGFRTSSEEIWYRTTLQDRASSRASRRSTTATSITLRERSWRRALVSTNTGEMIFRNCRQPCGSA
jgi:hypothetical protein